PSPQQRYVLLCQCRLYKTNPIAFASGIALEQLYVVAGNEPCKVGPGDLLHSIEFTQHVPGIALRIARRPHAIEVLEGIAAIARHDVTSSFRGGLDALAADSMRGLRKPASNAGGDFRIAFQKLDAALCNGVLKQVEVFQVQRRKRPIGFTDLTRGCYG